MFDTYLDRRSVNVRQDTHITQQPHDAADAARLYGELEEKALDRVQNRVVMQLPSFDAPHSGRSAVSDPDGGRQNLGGVRAAAPPSQKVMQLMSPLR